MAWLIEMHFDKIMNKRNMEIDNYCSFFMYFLYFLETLSVLGYGLPEIRIVRSLCCLPLYLLFDSLLFLLSLSVLKLWHLFIVFIVTKE